MFIKGRKFPYSRNEVSKMMEDGILVPAQNMSYGFGKNNLKPGYTFNPGLGSMDRIQYPDGSYGPSIRPISSISDSTGKVVAKQGDANWNDFYNAPDTGSMPPERLIPPTAPVSPIGGGIVRPQPAPSRFGGIRRAILGRGK